MALCSKGLSAVKNLWHKITPEMEIILEDVLAFTSKIKALEANPAVQVIEAFIPGAPAFQTAVDTAINALTTTASIIAEPNTTQKLTDFINEIKALAPKAANGQLLKLASLVVTEINAAQAGTPLAEVEADSLIQLKLIIDKAGS
jgi:hypothetical protein